MQPAEAWRILPKGLRDGFTELGTCELEFEGCIEVHQAEKDKPEKGDKNVGN